MKNIVQIVPRCPGVIDGVTDYAVILARELAASHSILSRFVTWTTNTPDRFHDCGDAYDLTPLLSKNGDELDAVILHYVNYGYHPRGIPSELPALVKRYIKDHRARLVVMFHELYASGPPWRSEFWLRPIQVAIARKLIDLADVCFVSNRSIKDAIAAHSPAKPLHVVPVTSTLGEPKYSTIPEKSPSQWAICGGNTLLARSLRSFIERPHRIPESYCPETLLIIGGKRSTQISELIAAFKKKHPKTAVCYNPEVSLPEASNLLSQCSFAWLDYFGSKKAWPGMIFKSTSFAACCAHGIVPVLSHQDSYDCGNEASLPGPYFITSRESHFPPSGTLRTVQQAIYEWYHLHASAAQVSRAYAEALS